MRTEETPQELAARILSDGLRAVFVSPNVPDSNLEPANLVDVVDRLANGLFAVANAIENGSERLARAIESPGAENAVPDL
jgi:hypothetical protein